MMILYIKYSTSTHTHTRTERERNLKRDARWTWRRKSHRKHLIEFYIRCCCQHQPSAETAFHSLANQYMNRKRIKNPTKSTSTYLAHLHTYAHSRSGTCSHLKTHESSWINNFGPFGHVELSANLTKKTERLRMSRHSPQRARRYVI